MRTNVRSPRFPELVLQPRRIDIDKTKRTNPSAFAHFRTSDAPSDYRQLPGLAQVDVWVEDDTHRFEEIAEEYREMRLQGLCEAEFATFGKDCFFRGQRRAVRVAEDSLLRAERMVQPVSLPDDDTWQVPPVLLPEEDAGLGNSAAGAAWAGDVRPDCSYWLSLRGFNYEYSFQLQTVTYVKSNALCPYLTIEFKRDGEPEDVAIAQVAAAGAIALYNRFRLYRSAVASKNDQWVPVPVDDLRHYGITFVGSQYIVWVLRVRVDASAEWDGCVMERLVTADCSQHWVAARELARWINEIHRWGLMVHGLECKDEIKAVLRGTGVRTSDLRSVV
ncbi:hypothetical protein DIS24_g11484 [Lasiodiplodia hormozganensis]|uniref:Uncharacterized protein n=1 Tax=Lasiodiplodia hormozganensis TaxID=869390 RepID=A0AA40C0Q4_9PEZI|nr:hypothetical protein DIS24_g11484 [Lasiodiplodia hormozganensis]